MNTIDIKIKKQLGINTFNYTVKIDEFDILGVFGNSGVGKSTFINMIAGIIKPDFGYIKISDRVLFDSQNKINIPIHQRNIGVIFQDTKLFPHLSVKSNLLYGCKRETGCRSSSGDKNDINFDNVVSILDIEPLLNRKPNKLSGGEKSRVAIGRAILSRPKLLLMDEPNASLDSSKKEQLLDLYKVMATEFNIPTIFVTHSKDELKKISKQIIIIEDFSIKAIIPSDTL